MFEVLFATKSEGVPKMPWAPKEGDDFVVGKREAHAGVCNTFGVCVENP